MVLCVNDREYQLINIYNLKSDSSVFYCFINYTRFLGGDKSTVITSQEQNRIFLQRYFWVQVNFAETFPKSEETIIIVYGKYILLDPCKLSFAVCMMYK